MNGTRLRTVLVGLGKIGSGYSEDPVMARHYPYATHAQVLARHPAFSWDAVVDISEPALATARGRWGVKHAFRSLAELAEHYQPEVAIVATPLEGRLSIIEQLPTVRAVLVEKPLGLTIADGQRFLSRCRERGVLVHVNLWRRADDTFRMLAAGGLAELIGNTQAAFGLYGNGLLNNGTHMVDFVRMLLGEIEAVQSPGNAAPYPAGPIPGDINVPFLLRLCNGLVVNMQPIRFEHYRENALDLWGEKGRLFIAQEGLGLYHYPCETNRAMSGEREIASDCSRRMESTVGHALYRMYDNLAASIAEGAESFCPGTSALRTARAVQAVLDSVQRDGEMIPIGDEQANPWWD